jgi:chromosome partitioning protein
MIGDAHSIARWLGERWNNASTPLRIVYLLIAVAFVTLLVLLTPFAFTFKDWIGRLDPLAQSGLLMFLLIGWAALMLFSWQRNNRVEEVKDDNAQLRARLEAAEKDAQQQQQVWNHLLSVESKDGIWHRKCEVPAPPMLNKSLRSTRFVTVINFKGGVGKTTLTANLAAGLALGKPALRVLVVDVDFQGTLGSMAVDPVHLANQIRYESFINKLLTSAAHPDLLQRLPVPMRDVPGVEVILATDTLAPTDFELQARFFMDPTADPRYHFRRHLHDPEALRRYDVVLFDCPPRVTTSVVNAVTCSDYVLIPTRLDRGSIDSVPRTVKWLRELNEHCPAEVLGVVACHASMWRDRLTNADRDSYEDLRGEVEEACGKGMLFGHYVPYSAAAAGSAPGRVASADPEGREVFAKVVAEFRKRAKV